MQSGTEAIVVRRTRTVSLTRRGLMAIAAAAVAPTARADVATDQAYTTIAHWLFDRYVDQAIAITRHNAGLKIPGALEAINKEAPALTRFLGRHRDAFASELLRPLRDIVPAAEAPRVAERVSSKPPQLDEATLRYLRDVDLEFRRNSQRVLRAMTFEVDLLVEQVLENLLKPKN